MSGCCFVAVSLGAGDYEKIRTPKYSKYGSWRIKMRMLVVDVLCISVL